MESVTQFDQGLAIHFVRNIVGRVTYGLVGLDKLLQGNREESRSYLQSFLSLFQISEEEAPGEAHRLLPQVEDTLGLYNPKLKDGLVVAATNIQKIKERSPDKAEIEQAYSQLESLLNMIYEATATQYKSFSR